MLSFARSVRLRSFCESFDHEPPDPDEVLKLRGIVDPDIRKVWSKGNEPPEGPKKHQGWLGGDDTSDARSVITANLKAFTREPVGLLQDLLKAWAMWIRYGLLGFHDRLPREVRAEFRNFDFVSNMRDVPFRIRMGGPDFGLRLDGEVPGAGESLPFQRPTVYSDGLWPILKDLEQAVLAVQRGNFTQLPEVIHQQIVLGAAIQGILDEWIQTGIFEGPVQTNERAMWDAIESLEVSLGTALRDLAEVYGGLSRRKELLTQLSAQEEP